MRPEAGLAQWPELSCTPLTVNASAEGDVYGFRCIR